MKQKQYSPMDVAEMAVSLFAVDRGYMDDVELEKIGDFEVALQSYMGSTHSDLMKSINATPEFNDEVESKLKSALDDFKANNTW